MRVLFILATGVFWLLLFFFWRAAQDVEIAAPESVAPVTATFSLAQVAAHAGPQDCWMAINGQVYDLGVYLPEHPARSGLIEEWCGKEATAAYRTKLRGRPHSPQADKLLGEYRIGTLLQP